MKWWEITPWGFYTTANEIQEEAVKYGYEPKVELATGLIRPGRDANNALRKVVKDPGLRAKYTIKPYDVISIVKHESIENEKFIAMFLEQGIINPGTLRNHEHLQLYSCKAAEAVLGVWFSDVTIEVRVNPDHVQPGTYMLDVAAKNLALGRDQKKNKLFGQSRKLEDK